MKKIYSAEGLDESTARLVVEQEQAHGRYVEASESNGRWCVSVYLVDRRDYLHGVLAPSIPHPMGDAGAAAHLELTPNAPDWLRRVWQSDERGKT